MRNGGIQIRISDMLFILQKRWKTIAGMTLLGLVFGLVLSGMTYVQSSFQNYEIVGSYAITTQNAYGQYINGSSAANNNDFHLAEDMVDAVTYILRSDQVISNVINDQQLLGVGIDQIKDNLSISQYNSTQILEMVLTWSSPEEGLEIWNAIVSSANQEMPEILQLGSLAVINEAQAQVVGVGTANSLQLWLLLAFLGFAAGLGFAIMELLVHPTLTNVKDVENVLGLETLGVIPQDNKHFRNLGSILSLDEAEASEVVQNYSAAAYILRNRLGTKEKHHCFYVTSASTQEGKTSVAANLAVQLSDMEHRTLLIDFNTRNPGLGSLFLNEVDYAHSLNALYRGEATVAEAITTLTGYLDLLPTVLEHNPIPMDGTIEDLISRLTEKYEYIIIDAAPVGLMSDTLSLNKVASAVLFVVGYDNTTIPEIQNSLEKLVKSGIRIIGCIVNGLQKGSATGRRDDGNNSKAKKRRSTPKAVHAAPPPHEPDLVDDLKASTSQEKKTSSETRPAESSSDESPKQNVQQASTPSEQRKAMPKPAEISQPRNIMDDLLVQADHSESKATDHDMMSALLQIGINGDWQDDKDNNAES